METAPTYLDRLQELFMQRQLAAASIRVREFRAYAYAEVHWRKSVVVRRGLDPEDIGQSLLWAPMARRLTQRQRRPDAALAEPLGWAGPLQWSPHPNRRMPQLPLSRREGLEAMQDAPPFGYGQRAPLGPGWPGSTLGTAPRSTLQRTLDRRWALRTFLHPQPVGVGAAPVPVARLRPSPGFSRLPAVVGGHGARHS